MIYQIVSENVLYLRIFTHWLSFWINRVALNFFTTLEMSEKLREYSVALFCSDKALLIFRTIFFIGTASYVIVFPFLSKREADVYYLYYLTRWNWILLALYFLLGVFQSISAVKKASRNSINIAWKVLFSTVQPIAIAVTVVYWLLLSDAVFDSATYSLEVRLRFALEHCLNLFLPLLDLMLSNVKVQAFYVFAPVFWLSAYETMVLLWHFLGNTYWPYSFLAAIAEDENGTVKIPMIVAFIVGSNVAIAILFFFVIGIVAFRDLIARRILGKSTQYSSTSTIVVV
jgi:hypothetical protein